MQKGARAGPRGSQERDLDAVGEVARQGRVVVAEPALEAPRVARLDRCRRIDGNRRQVERDAARRSLDDVHDLVVATDVAGEADDALATGRVEEALGLAREEVAELAGWELGGVQGQVVVRGRAAAAGGDRTR